MQKYISLIEYTQQGIENVKHSPDRLDAARQLAESMGANLQSYDLTFGRYDAVAVFEAPDDETAARFALRVGSEGAISTETMRAFPEEEFRDVVEGIPE